MTDLRKAAEILLKALNDNDEAMIFNGAILVRQALTKPKWVGLTEEDYVAINQSCSTKLQAAASAETILKDKNT